MEQEDKNMKRIRRTSFRPVAATAVSPSIRPSGDRSKVSTSIRHWTESPSRFINEKKEIRKNISKIRILFFDNSPQSASHNSRTFLISFFSSSPCSGNVLVSHWDVRYLMADCNSCGNIHRQSIMREIFAAHVSWPRWIDTRTGTDG